MIKVLVACEFSGVVRNAFNKIDGFKAISCDILPTEGGSPHLHYEGDTFDVLYDGFDLLIAHPPCTYLANSGVRWLKDRPRRWKKMQDGAWFFKRLMDAPIKHKAIENPIMHKYAVEVIGRRQDQCIQPWQFGHEETKAICLWVENLPLLEPTKIMEKRIPRVHHEPPSVDRWKRRSRFYAGVADAMACQWGDYIRNVKKQ